MVPHSACGSQTVPPGMRVFPRKRLRSLVIHALVATCVASGVEVLARGAVAPTGGDDGAVAREAATRAATATVSAARDADEDPAGPGPAGPRPRVGLVLSGGGARGAAHIGVLRVLEELDIRVDAIAGTSMGSIIGGLYAAGLSPDEIEDAIGGVAWGETFSDKPPRSHMSLRRKRDQRDFMVALELGLKRGGFAYSRGIFQGQNLDLLIKRFAATAELIEDFDALPIPYRAVATDAATGESVVIDSGDLATAMRASMSVPGVFEPVLLDGRLLVDGGLSAQTPVHVVRRMGVDVVIVVDLTVEDDVSASALNTPFGLLANLLMLDVTRNARNDLDSLEDRDVLIKPDLGTFTSTDFANAVAIIGPGEDAARSMAWRLREFSCSPGEFDDYLASMRRERKNAFRVDRIVVRNGSRLSDDVILGRLGVEAGDIVDFEHLQSGIEYVYGLGYFEKVTYDIQSRGGENVLVLHVERKEWGPVYARFGLELHSDFRGNSGFDAGTRILVTEVDAYGAEWITDVQIGDYNLIRTAFYQPLERSLSWFVEPSVSYSVDNFDIFLSDGSRVAEYQLEELRADVDLGYTFGNWGEVRAGIARGAGKGSRVTGSPFFPSGNYDLGALDAQFETDTLDRWDFPSAGEYLRARFEMQLEELGSSQTIGITEVDATIARSLSSYTVHAWTTASISDRDPQTQNVHGIGGLFRLSGLAEDELLGQVAGMAGLGVRKRFGDLESIVRQNTYLGLTLETGGAWFPDDSMTLDSMRVAGSLFVAMDSFVGPMYAAWGHAEGGRDRLYLVLGRSVHHR